MLLLIKSILARLIYDCFDIILSYGATPIPVLFCMIVLFLCGDNEVLNSISPGKALREKL